MKAVKAWAIASSGGAFRCAVSGKLYLYLKRNEAYAEKWFDQKVIRVEIRPVEKKRKS